MKKLSKVIIDLPSSSSHVSTSRRRMLHKLLREEEHENFMRTISFVEAQLSPHTRMIIVMMTDRKERSELIAM